MRGSFTLGALGVTVILAGCAQTEEPAFVRPEPVYDKFGGECEGDFIYIPGSVPEYDECVPEDECEPTYDAAGNIIDCIPPEERDPDDDDDDPTGRRPPTAGAG